MQYIQEAVEFTSGNNFMPMRMRYRLPNKKTDTSIFLLSDSYEYDVQLIKNMPPPRIDYKTLLIPYRLMNKIGHKRLRYIMTQNEYIHKVSFINNDKHIIPRINVLRYPYPTKIEANLYIPLSELFKQVNPILREMNVTLIRDSIFDIFNQLTRPFNFSKQKVLMIDSTRYEINRTVTMNSFKSNIINALLAAYILTPQKIKPLNWTIIFRHTDADYKFDLSKFDIRDIPRMKKMLEQIGTQNRTIDDDVAESLDDIEEDTGEIDNTIDELDVDDESPIEELKKQTKETDAEEPTEQDENIQNLQSSNRSVTKSLNASINQLMSKYGKIENDDQTQQAKDKRLYNAKAVDVHSKLTQRIHKINPQVDVVDNYEKITADMNGDNINAPVENQIISQASQRLSKVLKPVDINSVLNTLTSPRELSLRSNLSKIKMDKADLDNLESVTDVPLPTPLKPIHITTTNAGVAKGSSFANISKEYEENMLDQDMISVFMNLSNLDDGFYVHNVEVTDISNVNSLMHNWKITLKNNKTNHQSVINIRVPKMINGRFYNNGTWFNIGKQDFPIPILKIDKKRVIMTSNYNKITVERYDTRSLVDIGMMVKVLSKIMDEKGLPKYFRPGSSTVTNSRFISTVEYDEYAKQWIKFMNPDVGCEIEFNRVTCEKKYEFVNVQDNEFCCGMINKVPIIINVDTGLTRDNRSLTDVMLRVLPDDVQNTYRKTKPGKMSMYTKITIGMDVPLGIAVAAWEGISSLLKKGNCKYQFVDKNFSEDRYFVIPFKDKNLAIENTIANQLLFNGFYRINTKAYEIQQMETPIMDSNSIYVDIFNQLFFKQYAQLNTFITYYKFFVDPMTKEVCKHYHIPDDISSMLIYASNLLVDNSCASESNAALYRIRTTEILPAIVHYVLACAISKYNNSTGAKTRGQGLTINPNEVMKLLLTTRNVNPSSALNPVVELHERETVTKSGFRGVNNERAYTLDKRSYDESMIGKVAMSSPNSANVGMSRQLVVDPKIESVRGYTADQSVDTEYSDIQLASFSELLTPGTVTRDNAIRTAIATSQSAHQMPTAESQPTLVSNGLDEFVALYTSEEFSAVAEEDGSVLEITDGYMIIQYKSGKKRAINLQNRYSANGGGGFYVDNQLTANFKADEKFKRGDILAFHDKFFTKDIDGTVRYNVGPLAKVAFAGLYSTYEDAGLITEKMSRRLATKLTMKQVIKLKATDDIEKIVKVGDEVEIQDPLVVFGMGDTGDKAVDNFLRSFKGNETNVLESAKRIIKSDHAGTVVKVCMNTIKSLDRLSPSLAEIFSEYYNENKRKRRILDKHDKSNSVYKLDTFYDEPTEPIHGTSIKGITCDILIEIYIEHSDDVSVGDKLAIFGASKQIDSEVVPLGLEPYSESDPDEEVSLFVAPDSILKRMIPSLVVTAAANKVLVNLKRQITKIWKGQ